MLSSVSNVCKLSHTVSFICQSEEEEASFCVLEIFTCRDAEHDDAPERLGHGRMRMCGLYFSLRHVPF